MSRKHPVRYACGHMVTERDWYSKEARARMAEGLHPGTGRHCAIERGPEEVMSINCDQCHADTMQREAYNGSRMWREDLIPKAGDNPALKKWLQDTRKSTRKALDTELLPRWEEDTLNGTSNSIYDAYPRTTKDTKKRMLEHVNWWQTGQEADPRDSYSSYMEGAGYLSGGGGSTCSGSLYASSSNSDVAHGKARHKSSGPHRADRSSHQDEGNRSHGH